ncbi:MAG TPA: hypothetical protein VM866_03275 [Pyrinomonadaceae bacterium]|jgi:hypothetical protein|nr:hypothetical protein [Pyrinomonadaceae bacterium]
MFCPQCGQQQISGEIRFCSRCGLPLNVVAEVLAAGGALPSNAFAMHGGGGKLSPRQRGVRQGAMLMLSTMLLVPLIAIITSFINAGEEFFIPIVAVGCFVGGLLRIIYALMFEEKFSPDMPAAIPQYVPPGMPVQMNAAATQNPALPPRQSTPVPSFMPPRRGNTAELVHPPSVTDHTTRLLKKDRPDTESEAR